MYIDIQHSIKKKNERLLQWIKNSVSMLIYIFERHNDTFGLVVKCVYIGQKYSMYCFSTPILLMSYL